MFFSSPLQKSSRMSYEEDSPNIYPFYEVSTIYSGFELLSRSPEIFFFIFFIHLHLFDCVSLLYSQVGFLFSEHSDFFLHLVVLSLLSCVVFRFSLLVRCIFLCKIPSLCHEWIYHCLYWVPNSFSFLTKRVMSSMYIMELIFSCKMYAVEWHYRNNK